MTSNEVLDIILNEIKNKTTVSNLHGINLNKALVKPIMQEYKNAMDRSQSFTLWTVLEEDEAGYTIFYDDDENSFGLGMKEDTGVLIYLAHYGTFLETLKGM